MTQSKHDQMLALVDHLQNYGCRSECEMHEDREDAADALTALLEENATLRTEKHADGEAIGALREALKDAGVEIEHLNQLGADAVIEAQSDAMSNKPVRRQLNRRAAQEEAKAQVAEAHKIANRIASNLFTAGWHKAAEYVLSDWMHGQIMAALGIEQERET